MSLRKEQDFPEINPTGELKFKHLCFGLGGGGAGSTGGQANDGGEGEGGMGDVGDEGGRDSLGNAIGSFGYDTPTANLIASLPVNRQIQAFNTIDPMMSSMYGPLGNAATSVVSKAANGILGGLLGPAYGTVNSLSGLLGFDPIGNQLADKVRDMSVSHAIGNIAGRVANDEAATQQPGDFGGPSEGDSSVPSVSTATTSTPGATGENQLASVYDNSGMAETIDETAQISPEFLASIMQNRTAAPLINNATYGDEENPTLLDYVRTHMGFV